MRKFIIMGGFLLLSSVTSSFGSEGQSKCLAIAENYCGMRCGIKLSPRQKPKDYDQKCLTISQEWSLNCQSIYGKTPISPVICDEGLPPSQEEELSQKEAQARNKELLKEFGFNQPTWQHNETLSAHLNKIKNSLDTLHDTNEVNRNKLLGFVKVSTPAIGAIYELVALGTVKKDVHQIDTLRRKVENALINTAEELYRTGLNEVQNFQVTMRRLVSSSPLDPDIKGSILSTCLLTTPDTNTEPEISKTIYLLWKLAGQIDEINNNNSEQAYVFEQFYGSTSCISGDRNRLFITLCGLLAQRADMD